MSSTKLVMMEWTSALRGYQLPPLSTWGSPEKKKTSEGRVTLLVTIEDEYNVSRTVIQEFNVVDKSSPYKCILGRHLVDPIMAINSTFHQTSLFLDENWKVGRTRGSQSASRACIAYSVHQSSTEVKRVKGFATFWTTLISDLLKWQNWSLLSLSRQPIRHRKSSWTLTNTPRFQLSKPKG